MLKAVVIISLIAVGSANVILAKNGWGGGALLDGRGILGDGRGILVDSLAKPTPYAFGYDVQDEYGTQLTRQESGDGNGSVKGSYSYKDDKGLTRIVDYVADGYGFRATVKTNEPGTETSKPADVEINANPVYVDQPRLIARPLLARGILEKAIRNLNDAYSGFKLLPFFR